MAKSVTLKILVDTRNRVNEDPALRKLGSCDLRFGIRFGNRYYAVEFSGFECTEVVEIDADELGELDFSIEMNKNSWADFLASQETDQPQDLHALDLDGGIVKSQDQRRRLAFTQYYRNLELFFSHTAA